MGFAEWIAVGVVMTVGAVLIGFPVGVAVGYAWRNAISRSRRIRYQVERERQRAKPDGAAAALVRDDV
jgi:uncharacterized protein (DUF2062 family)